MSDSNSQGSGIFGALDREMKYHLRYSGRYGKMRNVSNVELELLEDGQTWIWVVLNASKLTFPWKSKEGTRVLRAL